MSLSIIKDMDDFRESLSLSVDILVASFFKDIELVIAIHVITIIASTPLF